jgi:hypothetical protein
MAPSRVKAVEVLTKGIDFLCPSVTSFKIRMAKCGAGCGCVGGTKVLLTYTSAAMLFSRAATLQSRRSACVDYSAGNGGALMAYRFDGESDLSLDQSSLAP